MRRFLLMFTGGRLGHRDRRDRCGRLVHCDCCARHYHGGHRSIHSGYARPIRDSGRPGSRSVVQPGNSAVPIGRSAAASNTAALAGNTALVESSTVVVASNTPRHLNSKSRRRRNRQALARCRPQNCSSWLLRRNRARMHQETIPIVQSEEFGGAVFDRAWRPPGPRVSHTSDAGRRQSIIR
jgi:hypothetical protein